MNNMDIFKTRVKQVIDDSDLTLSQICKMTNISSFTLDKWIYADYPFDVKMSSVLKFAKFFNISIDWLFGLTDDGDIEQSFKTQVMKFNRKE